MQRVRNKTTEQRKNVKYKSDISIEIVIDEQKNFPNRWALKYSFESFVESLKYRKEERS